MILCSGCFDGLHAGHVAYLRAARALGDADELFVVAVAGDQYIRRHKRRAPLWSFNDRADVISELRGVDQVWMHGPTGAAEVIRRVQPRLFVKGADWERDGLPADVIDACIDTRCRIVFVNTEIARHTSDALSAHQ